MRDEYAPLSKNEAMHRRLFDYKPKAETYEATKTTTAGQANPKRAHLTFVPALQQGGTGKQHDGHPNESVHDPPP